MKPLLLFLVICLNSASISLATAEKTPQASLIRNSETGSRLEITAQEFGYQVVSHAQDQRPESYLISYEYFPHFAKKPYQGRDKLLLEFTEWGWWGVTGDFAWGGPIMIPVVAIMSLPLLIADLPFVPYRLLANHSLQLQSGKKQIRKVFQDDRSIELGANAYENILKAIRHASYESIRTNFLSGYDTWRNHESKRLARKNQRSRADDPYYKNRPTLECDFLKDGVFVTRSRTHFGTRTTADGSRESDVRVYVRNFHSDTSDIGLRVFIADDALEYSTSVRNVQAYHPEKNRYLIPIIYAPPHPPYGAPEATRKATLYGLLPIDLSTMKGSLSFHQRIPRASDMDLIDIPPFPAPTADIEGTTTMNCALIPGER